jgi:hypothetical protein
MRRRRQSPFPIIVAIVLTVALAVSLLANWSLVKTGEFTLPGSSNPILAAPKKEAPAPPREDLVAVYVPARDLPAFHQITLKDFFRDDGTPSVIKLPKEAMVGSSSLLATGDSIGRVLRREKVKNRAFHPTDFFPAGTQPGLTAGVPMGMVGRWVDCQKVQGLEGLAMGDTIALTASSTVEPLLPQGLTDEERVNFLMQFRLQGLDRQAEVRRVVTFGLVVQPPVPRVDENGKKTGMNCFLALDPIEAIDLTAALQVGDQVQAITQSGQAEAGRVDLQDIVADDPLIPVNDRPRPAEVEQIEGASRRTQQVPRGQAPGR